MKLSKDIKGTGVAIVTPFHNYGTIDFSSLEKLLNHIINGGVDFIVAMGTTSETATLTADEKAAVLDYVLEVVNGKVPVVLGIGGNSTQSVISTIKKTNFDGISAILSVAPYYNKPNQKGLIYHFKNISGASPVPVIIYNVPGRTSVNITAESTLKLAEESENIVAVKEASGNIMQVMEILRNKPDDFKLFSGDDALTFPMLTLGADGVISVVANAYPKEFSKMVSLTLEGNYSDAQKIHYSLLPFINLLFADGNPSGIKAALDNMNILKNNLRLPLVKANKSVYMQLEKFIKTYKFPL
jgi:4-hydroxy-tetrahydrodipicolinate synthase